MFKKALINTWDIGRRWGGKWLCLDCMCLNIKNWMAIFPFIYYLVKSILWKKCFWKCTPCIQLSF